MGRRSEVADPIDILEDNRTAGAKIGFSDTLSWRAGKAIPVADLLRRLQALAAELKPIEQETANTDSFKPTAKELASANLLTHKDKGVRAWTAVCLVEVMRLFAPNAPYTPSQLKDIFTLLITHVIPSLADPTNPYNLQHQHVLQSLASVKSIIPVSDVPSSQTLIVRLFSTCFDTLSGPLEDLSKQVEYNMTGLLQCMIDEAPTLPTEAIDITLAQFLRADPYLLGASKAKKTDTTINGTHAQATLSLRQLPASYNLAKNLCNTCEDRMVRYVSQYFSSVIVEASSYGAETSLKAKSRRKDSADSDEDDNTNVPSEDDLKNLNKAHRLLRELWRAAPGVLQNVIPQIEAELATENVDLRMLATEAVGDLTAGIGAGGHASHLELDPAAYPYRTLDDSSDDSSKDPACPQSFIQSHSAAFKSFLGRRNDKSPLIRAHWATCIGRILTSPSGARDLNSQAEQELLEGLSHMLVDVEEKVRLAAIDAIGMFSFKDIVYRIGALGNVSREGSLLHNLADRVKDRKQSVRRDAMRLLGRMWGSAAGEMLAGNERVISLLGHIPSKIFDAYYINDAEINGLIYDVLFESLLPLGFPVLKKKEKTGTKGNSQDSPDADMSDSTADTVRTERILILLKDLDQRARPVFFAHLSRPAHYASCTTAFLKRCEDYNGGVMDKDEVEIRKQLKGLINFLTKDLPDSGKATDELWKFAKLHDRRSYGLLRFCIAPDSDYKRIYKSIKELRRRLDANQGASASMINTVTVITYRISNLFLNKSHIRPIIKSAQTENHVLAPAAQDLLKLISTKNPGVFKTHAEELCRSLEAQAPSVSKANEQSALDQLKALATFATRFPADIPKDRKFYNAMVQFVLYGSPSETAKHAVSIIVASSEKKEMHTRDILEKSIKAFDYGSSNFVVNLAALSQLMLLSSPTLPDEEVDVVNDIAIKRVLLRSPKDTPTSPDPSSEDLPDHNASIASEKDPSWQQKPDPTLQAKLWALRILTNRLRAYDDIASISEIATPVLQLLNLLIAKEGELSKTSTTPKPHRAVLRLEAGLLLLKLCAKKERGFDALVTPQTFNRLILLAQDPVQEVRAAFIEKVRKYLGQERLSPRFYVPVFLLAFEPDRKLRTDSTTWLRARAAALALKYPSRHVMESVLARLLSALAHHPDFEANQEGVEIFTQYILFYAKSVINDTIASLAFQVAQRVKGVRDAIAPKPAATENDTTADGDSGNLYTLSDLAQCTLRHLSDTHNWSMQALSTKVSLPSGGLFKALPSHEVAQEIAEKVYLPDGADELVERLVRRSLKKGGGDKESKKRKSDDLLEGGAAKRRALGTTASNGTKGVASKARPATSVKAKPTPKPKKQNGWSSDVSDDEAPRKSMDLTSSAVRRKSGRSTTTGARKSYADTRDSDDDEDMRMWDEGEEDKDEDENAPVEVDGDPIADGEEDEAIAVESRPAGTSGTKTKPTPQRKQDQNHDPRTSTDPLVHPSTPPPPQTSDARSVSDEDANSEKENTPVPPPSAGSTTDMVVRSVAGSGKLKHPAKPAKVAESGDSRANDGVAKAARRAKGVGRSDGVTHAAGGGAGAGAGAGAGGSGTRATRARAAKASS
ncbi:MAG: hypothetical protein M1828_002010 [Chrysothrix sp. TS-e1954]|nr:MAG: hypothetical protein M1828_002010 [Chrysothrix sp. TS-e1954]